MNISGKLNGIVQTFMCITTGIVFVNAIYISVVYGPGSDVTIKLWPILMVAFLTSLCNLIYPSREVGRKEMLRYKIIHFFMINIIVLISTKVLGWLPLEDPAILITEEVAIIAIFFGTHWVMSWNDARLAEEINEKLKELEEDAEE